MSQEIIPYTERELTWEEQIEHILAELTTGRSVSSILRDDEGMPSPTMFWKRLYRDEELFGKISRAREFGAHAVLEQAHEVAMTMFEAVEFEEGVNGSGPFRKIKRGDALGHRRLVVDTLIKKAQMIAPRKYGPKLDVTSDGEKISSIAEAIAAGNARLAKEREQRGE
jgi:hypothetical protein